MLTASIYKGHHTFGKKVSLEGMSACFSDLEEEIGRILVGGQLEWGAVSDTQSNKISQVWWHTTVIPGPRKV
jgi:hypothetical protein